MSKRTSSIHIENALWDYIDEYKDKNSIDSRNTAIEWILVEHRIKCSNISNDKKDIDEKKSENSSSFEPRESDIILDEIEKEMMD